MVYFQCDGHSFKKGVRILYDECSVKEMVEKCLPHGAINLFVDHFNMEDLINTDEPNEEKFESGEDSEKDDPDFEVEEGGETENSDGSDCVNSDFLNDGSDEELEQFMELKNKKKERIV